MMRPLGTHTDYPDATWYRYWDAISETASHGHGLDISWDCGVAYVATTEDPAGDHLAFWPCSPTWVATWTVMINDDPLCADNDPLLAPIADGPDHAADSQLVGEWIAAVVHAIAGRRPVHAPSYRIFAAVGYRTLSGTLIRG